MGDGSAARWHRGQQQRGEATSSLVTVAPLAVGARAAG